MTSLYSLKTNQQFVRLIYIDKKNKQNHHDETT